MSEKADRNWAPGCGRPHPDYDLIMMWADGKVPRIETTRNNAGGKPLPQQFPTWNPAHSYKIFVQTQPLIRGWRYRERSGRLSNVQYVQAEDIEEVIQKEKQVEAQRLDGFFWVAPWCELKYSPLLHRRRSFAAIPETRQAQLPL